MMPPMRLLFSAARKCKRAARACFKGLREIPLFCCFGKKRNGRDEEEEEDSYESDDDSQNVIRVYREPRRKPIMVKPEVFYPYEADDDTPKAITVCTEPRRTPIMVEVEVLVHKETRYKNGYVDSDDECEIQQKTAKSVVNADKEKTVEELNKSRDTDVKKSSLRTKRKTGEENTTARQNAMQPSGSEMKSNRTENGWVVGFGANEMAAKPTYASVTKRCRENIVEQLKQNKLTNEDTTDLRMNGRLDTRQMVANNRCAGDGVENVLQREAIKSFVPKNIVQTGFDPKVDGKIRRIAKNIIDKYVQSHNLDDIIFVLVDDENSCIRTRHQQFVTCLTIVSLDDTFNNRTATGKMMARLLSEKVLSVKAIAQGIDAVLKDFNNYLTQYPQFFSHVAAIVAPLLNSETDLFDYNNLKYACKSIRPNNSALFFAEILQAIHFSEDVHNSTDFCETLRTFSKWSSQSKHVPLDTFILGKQLNKFIKNDRVGTLIIAMAMFDMTRTVSGDKSLDDITHKWICKHIDADVVGEPCFVRTLTIATVIACSNRLKSQANEDLIDRERGKLLDRYIRRESPAADFRSKEVECVDGCVLISTALGEREDLGGMSFSVFFQLYRDGVICKRSLRAWKNKNKSSTRTATAAILTSFFIGIDTRKSIENKV